MQKLKFDFIFFTILMCLIGIGISMIFSASSVLGLENYSDMYYFLKKTILNLIIGIVAMILVAKIPYQKVRKYIFYINVVTIGLLCLTYIPAFQEVSNGAGRWLRLGPLSFQPSEIAKLTIIFTLAHMIEIRSKKGTLSSLTTSKYGLFPIVGYIGLYVVLVLMQKHLSATGILLLISMSMLFVGELKTFYFVVMGLIVGFVGVIGVIIEPFRMKRIMSFLNPEADPLGAGYHIVQSWYALGSGEFFGLGLGLSRQKFSWLPENHTDFIVGIIGEEVGFIGIALVILLFIMLGLRGLWVAFQTKDIFGRLMVSGVVVMLFFQSLINMLVVSGWFPVTGMPLPFISYGGTSTIILLMAVGLIFNVSSQIEDEKPKKEEETIEKENNNEDNNEQIEKVNEEV